MNLPHKKQAGVCLHLTSLPGNYGIGELGAAAHDFIDVLAAMNLSVWQFLPTGPTAFGDSPYQPLSAFAGNEMLIDMENLVELSLLKRTEVDVLRHLPAASVDYGRLIPLKSKLLTQAAANFERWAGAELKAQFEQFIGHNDKSWLHDYALFRALKDHHQQRPWTEWDPAYSRRDSAALRQFAGNHVQQISTVKILQFLFDRQWATLRDYATRRGITLFGDMPIYIALDSADGQLWGNPLYDWDYHASHGFAWWVERLTHASALNDLTRIDHFRGFDSYWAIPAEATTARQGSWEPGPGDAIFTAVRAALGDLPIVAEDLGIITPEVDKLRDRQGLPGMRVMQFDIVADYFRLDAIAENCVCYTGTHDNDTTVGWFHGSPGDQRSAAAILADQHLILARTHGHANSIHTDVIRLAFDSNARLAIAPLQDYLGLGSEARFNIPGTSNNNWRWRLQPGQLTAAFIDAIAELTRDCGRGVSD